MIYDEDYVKVIILGGYHNGDKFKVNSKLDKIDLLESVEDYNRPLMSNNATLNAHGYKKLNMEFHKDVHKTPFVKTYREMEDLNIFVPQETTPEYEDTLREVIGKALNARWYPKYQEF